MGDRSLRLRPGHEFFASAKKVIGAEAHNSPTCVMYVTLPQAGESATMNALTHAYIWQFRSPARPRTERV